MEGERVQIINKMGRTELFKWLYTRRSKKEKESEA